MRTLARRRPSASMVVAILALVVAAGGTAAAAGHLVNGDRLIKKRSLSGNRLRNGTITGRQINMTKLGMVPSARTARTAGDAATVGGFSASAFESASHFIRTGIVKTPVGSSITLTSFGPFTLTLNCQTATSAAKGYSAEIDGVSTEADADGFGTNMAVAGQGYALIGPQYSVPSQNPAPHLAEANVVADFLAPSGAAYVADIVFGAGTYLGLTNTCYANALVTPS